MTIPNTILCETTDRNGYPLQALVPFGADPEKVFSELYPEDYAGAPVRELARVFAGSIRALLPAHCEQP